MSHLSQSAFIMHFSLLSCSFVVVLFILKIFLSWNKSQQVRFDPVLRYVTGDIRKDCLISNIHFETFYGAIRHNMCEKFSYKSEFVQFFFVIQCLCELVHISWKFYYFPVHNSVLLLFRYVFFYKRFKRKKKIGGTAVGIKTKTKFVIQEKENQSKHGGESEGDLNLLVDQGPLQCLLKCTRFVYYSY